MELVIPLIEESLQSPAKDYFEEDGIILWQTALWNAASPYQPTAETGLARLIPGLLNAVSENMDLLTKLLPLLDSYILLDPPGLIQNFGADACKALMSALTTSGKNAENVHRTLETIGLLVHIAPLEQLAGAFVNAGLFQHILQALEDDKASGTTLAAYLHILSRIALRDPAMFLLFVGEQARRNSRDERKLLEEVLDALWRNFDYVGGARSRKTVAMGAGALVTTGHPEALERLDGEVMNMWLDVLGELAPTDAVPGSGAAEVAVNHWKDDHGIAWSDIERSLEGARRRALEDADPAYAVPLRAFIVDVLTRSQAVGLGPYWDKADAGAKHSLEKFLA